MMNDQLMKERVFALCKITGLAIDKIAKESNINQDLVAKVFMESMTRILERMDDVRTGV